jgi:hypothetical protein
VSTFFFQLIGLQCFRQFPIICLFHPVLNKSVFFPPIYPFVSSFPPRNYIDKIVCSYMAICFLSSSLLSFCFFHLSAHSFFHLLSCFSPSVGLFFSLVSTFLSPSCHAYFLPTVGLFLPPISYFLSSSSQPVSHLPLVCFFPPVSLFLSPSCQPVSHCWSVFSTCQPVPFSLLSACFPLLVCFFHLLACSFLPLVSLFPTSSLFLPPVSLFLSPSCQPVSLF